MTDREQPEEFWDDVAIIIDTIHKNGDLEPWLDTPVAEFLCFWVLGKEKGWQDRFYNAFVRSCREQNIAPQYDKPAFLRRVKKQILTESRLRLAGAALQYRRLSIR